MQERAGSTVSTSSCSILSVSPLPEDHDSLVELLREYGWMIQTTATLAGAQRALRERSFTLVVCESDLSPGRWKDVLSEIQPLTKPPFLVVTSRTADEHLWAEALNLGAYDVLGKPFERVEVTRTLSMAWLHWMYLHGRAAGPLARGAGA